MKDLLTEVRNCLICESDLPHGIRPVLQISQEAKILVAGQAPGRKVHESGIPFDDASGERLRNWMGIDSTVFYDASKIAILPMGFCYPGKGKSGDLPPRKICADTWRSRILSYLKEIELTLVIGQYAMSYHLPNEEGNLTEIVLKWQKYFPKILPLPHPSPRNNIWLTKNSWFEAEVVPSLQSRVKKLLG
ncbi:uracil-DNA glycosylase family protein [Puniceicoccaceae bacterium K14]|nr:uracil-DNA glycosylase family protein [Puniceicoccaceae bacterium K14]